MTSENFREEDAAAYVGIASSTLAKMRMKGNGPAYIKAGKRLIIYRKADLEAWLIENRRCSTAEYRHA